MTQAVRVSRQQSLTAARWYVAQTLAMGEQYAMANMRDQGFTSFLPLFETSVLQARKISNVRRALFPGDVFISLDLGRDRWRSVNGARGVARLVLGQDSPLAVPVGVVETRQDLIDSRGLIAMDRGLKVDAFVKIIKGPLAQSFGEILFLDERGRSRVLLEMMKAKIAVRLERDALSLA